MLDQFINIILIVIGGIYGLLNVFAGAAQLTKKENDTERKINLWSAIVMAIGGVLVIISYIFTISYYLYIAIAGLILIHISTINNGLKMYGKLNWRHHIIRLLISVLIIVLLIYQ